MPEMTVWIIVKLFAQDLRLRQLVRLIDNRLQSTSDLKAVEKFSPRQTTQHRVAKLNT
jgi:hypothetical protein